MSFSSEIKTLLKLDSKNWEEGLESVKRAETSYFEETKKNTTTLIDSKEKLAKVESDHKTKLLSINTAIAKSEDLKTKAMIDGDTKKIASLKKTLELLKQNRTSLNASAKVAKSTINDTIAEYTKLNAVQEKSKAFLVKAKANLIDARDTEIAGIREVVAKEEELQKVKKVTANQLLDRLVRNKEIMSQQKVMTAREKELLFAEQKRIYAEKEAQSLGKTTLAQLKAKILANKELSTSTKTLRATEQQRNAFAKEQYSLLKQDLAQQEKNQVATESSTKSIDKKSKSMESLANQTIRYLRWAGTIAGVVYAGKRAWDATLGTGIEVNKIIETNTNGIAALVSANTQMIDSLGNTLTPLEKFRMGQEHAKIAIEEIRKESVKTAATFPQLLDIFQQGIGKALSMGDAFGTTTKDIEKNTIKLSARMSNFANAIGMPMDRVKEEMRSMLSANASTDSLISTIIFGSPTEANEAVRNAAKTAGGLTDLLEKEFKPFDILADTKTFEKSVLSVQDAWSRAMGDMIEKSGAFQDITDMFYEMSQDLKDNTDDIVDGFDALYNGAKDVASAIKYIAVPASVIASVLALSKVTTALGGAVVGLTIAIRANPILATLSAGVAGIYATSEAISDLMKNVEDLQNKAKAEQATSGFIAKGLQTDLKALDEQKKGIQASIDLWSKYNVPQEQIKKKQQELLAIEKQRATINQKLADISKADENKKTLEERLATAKKMGELTANVVRNEDLLNEIKKDEVSAAGKIAGFEKEKLQRQEELKKVQEEISKRQEQLSSTEEKNKKALSLVIKKLREDEATYIKGISLSEKEIANEKTKANERASSVAESRYKKTLAQTKAYAEQQAIETEIAMLESDSFDQSKLKLSLEEGKLVALNTEYSLTTDIADKRELYRDILLKSLDIQKLYTAEVEKQAQAEEKAQEAKTKIAVKALTGDFKRSINDDATLSGAESTAALIDAKIVDMEATEAQLEKFRDLVKTKLDDIKDDYFENDYELKIGLDTSGLDENVQQLYSISDILKDSSDEQEEWNERQFKYQGILESTSATDKEIAAAKKKYNEEESNHISSQINGYANIAGAMSTMFEEGTREAAAFQAIQTGLALVDAVRAIMTQGTGDPYSAFARMAAMAAMVGSLLSQVGVAFNGSGISESSDSFSSMEENTGAGTVLGDIEAQSESIQNAMETLEDFAEPQFSVLSQMNKYLESIDQKMGGISGLIYQNAGFAVGEGFTANNKSFSIQNSLPGYDELSEVAQIFTGTKLVDKLFGTTLGSDVFDVLSGATLINNVIGGLFGKTSQSLEDAGLYFGEQLIQSAIDEIEGSSYQAIKTTKKSWFKKSSSTKSYFEELDDETGRQFSLVLDSLYSTVLLAGESLDTETSAIEQELSDFVVNIGKISLKDKTADEIQEQITAVFGQIGDDLAEEAFPLMTAFQQVGEGLFSTLTRVSTGITEADFYIGKLGNTFEEISYSDIMNKQGDVGFEALLQSITNTDEAVYGLDNNLVQMISSLNGTAEELYSTFTVLDLLRDQLVFLGKESSGLSDSMVYGAGSVSELSSGIESYFENFLSDEEQLQYQTEVLNKELAKIGVNIPITKDAFIKLLEGIDLTTESGQELYGRVISLSDSFYDVTSRVEELSEATESFSGNVKTLLDSLRDTEDIARISGYGVGVKLAEDAKTFFEQFEELKTRGLGLTDEELVYLQNAKSYLLEKEQELIALEQEGINETLTTVQDFLSDVTNDISSLTNILQSLEDVISNLRGISETPEDSLRNFYSSMAKTQSLIGGGDYEAISESLNETIDLSSILSNDSGFKSQGDMTFAQLVAARQFEDMDMTLNDELDYLEQIEINTRETAEALTAQLENIGTSISESNSGLQEYFDSNYNPITGNTLSAEEQLIADKYNEIVGRNPDTEGLVYWKNQLLNGQSLSSLGMTMGAVAVNSGELSREEYVRLLYTKGFNRTPDESEIDYWTNQNNNSSFGLMEMFKNSQHETFTPFAEGGLVQGGMGGVLGLIGESKHSELVTPLHDTRDPFGMNALIAEVQGLRAENRQMKQIMIKLATNSKDIKNINRGMLDKLSDIEEEVA